ncbi:MAG: DUF1801 domain-containing protein [Terrimesophilobacter sp.]
MTTVEEYLAGFADSERALLESALAVIRAELPDAKERISYGVIKFEVEGMHPLYFGGWKKHVGIYPVPISPGEFEQELAPFRSAKNSLNFAWTKPMPLELIGRVATYVVQQEPN